MSRWRRWLGAVHWYLRELTGEADYDRYLARHASHRCRADEAPLTRREFDRRRWQDRSEQPGTRCC